MANRAARSSLVNRTRSSLVNRNVVVNGKRTSVRLEPAMWDALVEIGRREGRTVHEISSDIDLDRPESSLTASLRVHIMSYFREAATAEGHSKAGHGGVAAGA
ncbi:MAG: ribbon-helix-helix domain-containing protein [Proteobacteria bacterium]|nr:ribbon-helix-helix domain-containing protein [Pseudomonadota bacterium]